MKIEANRTRQKEDAVDLWIIPQLSNGMVLAQQPGLTSSVAAHGVVNHGQVNIGWLCKIRANEVFAHFGARAITSDKEITRILSAV